MTTLEDLRFAFRLLGKRPWLTAMIVMVMAIGIGTNTAVFTLFNAVLLRSLPFPEGERVVFAESVNRSEGERGMPSSYPDFLSWREATREIDGLAAMEATAFNLSDDAAAPERLSGARITANAFRTLRMEPVIGRSFEDGEDQPGADGVALLSYGVWQGRYGGDPEIVGRTIRIDARPHLIVGVMPQGFRFPAEAEIWLPLVPEGERLKRDNRWFRVFGRLADNATFTSAQGELDVLAERLQQQFPDTNDGVGIRLLTGNEQFNGGEIKTMFLAMMGAVGFVLLIACANVANVQLTRAADREREMSVRSALGAGRWRIVRQLLIESVVLSTAGGLLGMTLAYIGVRWFDLATVELRPYFIDFRFDLVVFGYLAGVCLLTGVLFGLAPAIHALRTNVNASLKAGSRSQTSGKGARRFSTAMVVGEVALSVVLLAGAGLMLRSFWNVYRMDLGVRTTDILVGLVSLPQVDYPTPEDEVSFHDAVLEQLRAIPGAVSVTSASHLPGQGFSGRAVEIEGKPADDPDHLPSEALVVVGADFFRTLDAPLLRGRSFSDADVRDSSQVAIVSRQFAEKHWPGADALGKRLRLGEGEDRPWLTVVGISRDIRHNSASEAEIRPAVYRPYRQEPSRFGYWLVQSRGEAAVLADGLREAVASVDPNLPVQDVMPLEKRMERSRWAYSVFGSIFSLFAAIALGMAAVGVFALVADSVRRRVPEFGVRLAFGAAHREILRLVLSQAMLRVGAGVALGLPLAYLGAWMIQTILIGVEPWDMATLAGVSMFLLGTSLAACWLPARRVIRIDPATALRNE